MHMLILPPKSVWFFWSCLSVKNEEHLWHFSTFAGNRGVERKITLIMSWVFLQGIFCKLFVDGDNCLELLPITAEILHRQHHTLKWKVGLKNLSESLLGWMETSPFLKVSLWARPWEPCNGISGRNQVNQEKKILFMLLLVFFSSSRPSTSPASFIFSFCRGKG